MAVVHTDGVQTRMAARLAAVARTANPIAILTPTTTIRAGTAAAKPVVLRTTSDIVRYTAPTTIATVVRDAAKISVPVLVPTAGRLIRVDAAHVVRITRNIDARTIRTHHLQLLEESMTLGLP